MSQEDRIVSAETLLQMREPRVVDGVVPETRASDTTGGDADPVSDAVNAAVGGSARLAPTVDVGGDNAQPRP
jgi:hypothetical protein